MQQEYGALIVERLAAGEAVSNEERAQGATLLVGLAEIYDGEHGLAYSAGALDIDPGHDRAVQLYGYYAQALGREEDVAARYLAYISTNPSGAMVAEARWLLASSYETAGQPENAIAILEPLRALGDPEATVKLRSLYAQLGQVMPSAVPGERASFLDGDANPSASRRGPTTAERVRCGARCRARARQRRQARRRLQEVPRGPGARSGPPRGVVLGAGLPADQARL